MKKRIPNRMNTDAFREIKKTRSRFLSLFLLSALAVAFLAGLRTTAPDMEYTADDYYDRTHLMDVRVLSALGLTEDDIAALAAAEGVERAEGAWYVDAAVHSEHNDLILRFHSLSEQGINDPELLEGRMPEADDECLVEPGFLEGSGFRVGDVITPDMEGTDYEGSLRWESYTIVGVVNSSLYMSRDRGTSSIGTGHLAAVAFLRRGAYDLDYYTEAYLRGTGLDELRCYDDGYQDRVDDLIDRLKPLGEQRADLRYQEVVGEANDKLADAQKEYDDAVIEVDEELADAWQELTDARQELDDGWAEYYDGEETLKQETADAEKKIADAEKELADALKKLKDGENDYADGVRELEDGKAEYYDGLAEYEDGLTKYEDGKAEYADGLAEYLDGVAEYEDGVTAYEDGLAKYRDGLTEYEDGRAEYEQGVMDHKEGKQKLEDGEAEYAENLQKLTDAQAEYEQGLADYEDGLEKLEEGKAQLAEAKTELDAAKKKLDSGRSQLSSGRAQYNSNLEQYNTQAAAYESGLKVAHQDLTQFSAENIASTLGAAALSPDSAFAGTQLMAGTLAGIAAAETTPAAVKAVILGVQPSLAYSDAAALQAGVAAALATGDPDQIEAFATPFVTGYTIIDTICTETETQLAEGKAALDAASAQLSRASARLSAGRTEYNEGLEAYRRGAAELEENEAKLIEAEEQLNEAKSELEDGWRQLAEGRAELDDGWAELEDAEKTLQEAKGQLEDAEKELQDAEKELRDAEAELRDGKEDLDEAKAKLEDAEAELNDAEAELRDAKAQLDDAWQEILDGEQELADARKELDDGWAEYRDGQVELADAKAELRRETAKARQELDDAYIELTDGEKEYADGLQEYEDGKQEAEEKLSDARRELNDARRKIAEIEECKWYLLGRNTNAGYVSYRLDSERMGNLAQVFPLIFFLVAALVCLTTMTRMVEEQRVQIGGMKALGYSRLAISKKYVGYGFLSSFFGGLVGLAVGCTLIPTIIFNAWKVMYTVGDLQITIFPGIYTAAVGAAVFCVTGTALAASFAALTAVPATLMRPKAPQAGKRVLLERVDFLWKRLSFTWKVTVRNLFRYKKRFLMAVIGIGGCTALLITGFGLRDSIHGFFDTQYDAITTYHGTVSLADKVTEDELIEIGRELDRQEQVVAWTTMSDTPVKAESSRRSIDEYVYLCAVTDETKFEEFIHLQDRETGEKVALPDRGAVVTEKLAELLEVGVGDVITIVDTDNVRTEMPISAITENYIMHFIYLSHDAYVELYKQEPEVNSIRIQYVEDTEACSDTVASRLLSLSGVSSVTRTDSLRQSVVRGLKGVDYAVIVVVVAAAALAFVVLYNLININITERLRELATLKVLGFTEHETAAYVYRENIFLTLFGILLGLVMGKYLHRWLVMTVEIDMAMFFRYAQPMSYVLAAILTAIFSVLVNLVAKRRIRKIDMVESLKTVE